MKVEISLTSLVPFLRTGNHGSVTAEVWGKEREEGQVGNIVSLGAEQPESDLQPGFQDE